MVLLEAKGGILEQNMMDSKEHVRRAELHLAELKNRSATLDLWVPMA